MRFAFGYGLDPADPTSFRAVARAAEQAGMSMVMVGDSPALLGDCYIAMALLADETSSCTISTFATNPVTRHPAVTASAVATAQTLSRGRAVLGIGTGDSGVYNLGQRPARLDQLEEYVGALRKLWHTGEATYRGTTLRTAWARDPVPVYIAAGGPKGLRLAGRVADGVFIEAGLLPEVVADAVDHVRQGAEDAGRDIADIDIWWHARADFGASAAEATARLASALAGIGNRLTRFGHEGKHVPAELVPAFEQLRARYEFMHHEEHVGQVLRNGPLLTELGLQEYLAARFGIVGTPDEWLTRLRGLDAIGVRQIAIAALMPDKIGFLRTFAESVLPHVASTSS